MFNMHMQYKEHGDKLLNRTEVYGVFPIHLIT